jgi:hypothetical protein
MPKVEGTIYTTHGDLQGEKFAVEGLESFVTSINENCLPFGVGHDIRNAPIGRITSAALVPLEDGEFAVKGMFDILEEGDTLDSVRGDGRKWRFQWLTIRRASTPLAGSLLPLCIASTTLSSRNSGT